MNIQQYTKKCLNYLECMCFGEILYIYINSFANFYDGFMQFVVILFTAKQILYKH